MPSVLRSSVMEQGQSSQHDPQKENTQSKTSFIFLILPALRLSVMPLAVFGMDYKELHTVFRSLV